MPMNGFLNCSTGSEIALIYRSLPFKNDLAAVPKVFSEIKNLLDEFIPVGIDKQHRHRR
jgi:hypothetical protein